MVPEKSEKNLQITSEEAVMTVNNEVVVHELITIDLLMIMSERMFIIVGAFLFGYCLGYYSFEFFQKLKAWDTWIFFKLQ